MEKKKKLTKDDYMYYSFLGTIILFFIAVMVYKNWLYRYIAIPGCVFYLDLGFYCPACGMTRAFLDIINMDFLKSIYHNPAVIYIVGYVFFYMVTGTICKILKRKPIMKYSDFYLYIGIIILLINWIIRNILLLGFGIKI